MGRIPPKGLVMAKSGLSPRGYVLFDVGCDLVQYENKIKINVRIHS